MRVLFVGNAGEYTTGFLEALASRSADPNDTISLVGVICPVRRDSRSDVMRFDAKRRIGALLERIPKRLMPRPLRTKVAGTTSGTWHQIQLLAGRAGAPVLWPRDIKDPDLIANVRALDADIAIVAGLDRILDDRLIAAFPPMFNIHPSLLPDYRGGAPEFWQLAAGETETGVTIHVLDGGVDTGPIVLQQSFPIEPWLDADGLLRKSVDVGIKVMNGLLVGFPAVAASTTPQFGGSHQPLYGPDDVVVAPVEQSAQDVFNRARAAGFRSPLTVHVASSDWLDGDVGRWSSGSSGHHSISRWMPCHPAARPDSVALGLFDPVPHLTWNHTPAGELTRTVHGGVVVACANGAVEFRRVHAATYDMPGPSPTQGGR